ncbi:hypothetical protein JYU34_003599 [Plutella xylostella]|uniref:Reverse transcriptase domain-containing protein n=1 Tax=Plutella xylostella TaxID=51655 RepID=A0ABQ7R0F9_PLUXY|nr:hypothetical protein JYU34_003599 [Plutella xylostella]
MANHNSCNISELFDCPNIQNYLTKIPKIGNSVTVIHINIRSMIKNFSKLLQCINDSRNRIDVIIITEANIKDSFCSLFNINGYEMHTRLRIHSKGGGIIIYINKKYKFQTLKFNTLHCETMIGKISVTKNHNIILCALYRPPDKNKNVFLKELQQLLTQYSTHDRFILIGDINIDLRSESIIKDRYLNLLSGRGLLCGITDYTRIEERNGIISKSCIDHVFIRDRTGDLYSAAIGTVLADHRMIAVTCTGTPHIQAAPKTISLIDDGIFFSHINNVDWSQTNTMKCPNEVYKFIATNLSSAYEKSTYTRKITNSKRNREKWITNKIRDDCKKRDQALINFKKDPNNKILLLQYKQIRNRTNKLIENTRNKYHKTQIHEHTNNPRKLWQILNSLTGQIFKSVDEAIIKAFVTDQSDEKYIANSFARTFEKNVLDIVPKCNQQLMHESEYIISTDKSMLYQKATNRNIHKIIKNLNPRKSPGQDGIRPIDIKIIGDKIVTAITNLINTSIKTTIYPDELKLGIVRPIHKKGKHDCFSNYRQITILPILDKIFEKYIAGLIHRYYEDNNILTDTQFGFRAKKSTTLLLSKFTDEINTYLDEKQHVVLVFIDYSKAFDTLKHDYLIKKLDSTGIRGPLLQWCQNYLTNRKYRVKINDCYSDDVKVSIGTAQGSVLGPLHYLVYVNDVTNIIKHCSLYQFADDTCLIAADKSVTEAMKKLQKDFTALVKWSHDAGLILNAQKTQMMHIRSSHNPTDHHVRLIAHNHDCLHTNNCNNCETIEQVKTATYLGLIIDDRFNWEPHVNKVCDKLRGVLAKISIVKYKVPYSVLLNMYKALVESIIFYGITSYGRTYKSYLDKICNLQIRILKKIVPPKIKQKCKGEYQRLFHYCGILPVHRRVEYALIVEQYDQHNMLNPIEHKIHTRSITNKKMTTARFKNIYGRRTNKYIVPTLFNELPTTLKNEINNKNLKNKLKEYFVKNLPT